MAKQEKQPLRQFLPRRRVASAELLFRAYIRRPRDLHEVSSPRSLLEKKYFPERSSSREFPGPPDDAPIVSQNGRGPPWLRHTPTAHQALRSLQWSRSRQSLPCVPSPKPTWPRERFQRSPLSLVAATAPTRLNPRSVPVALCLSRDSRSKCRGRPTPVQPPARDAPVLL